MSYVADLYSHSPYARGTSPQLTFENMALWARIKGIDLLATGDFTHPAQLAEIRGKLYEIGDGLYELDGIRFVLGTEVNCSAEQAGRLRRVHVLVFAPDLKTVDSINSSLDHNGKLASAGRPTVHLTPRDLLETLLGIDERCFIIPAHMWTPHFGLYGEKSGFDSLPECFGDLASFVPVIETGLSSDPAMNWRVPSLDGVSIGSFSDAHSLPKLGRELPCSWANQPTTACWTHSGTKKFSTRWRCSRRKASTTTPGTTSAVFACLHRRPLPQVSAAPNAAAN
jgi:DNA helicase-2/ATP-dependent DNA helicase PcrA